MDKTLGNVTKQLTKAGEKNAPIKSVKIKIKFQKTKKQRSAKMPNLNDNLDKNTPLSNRKASMNRLKRGMRGYKK